MQKYMFKILLIGAASVGKTSLMHRYVENVFSLKYKLTIGSDFLSKSLKFSDDKIGEIDVKLQIWDIAGQDKFKFLRKAFFDGANGALIIFDLTRLQTFDECKAWLSELYEYVSMDCPFVLIGNKLDLINQDMHCLEKRVTAQKFAEECDAIYVETSAKEGTHVEHAFLILVQKMIKRAIKSKAETLI